MRPVVLWTSWVIVSVCLLTSPAFAQRLPGTVVPDHYALSFAPDFQKDNFRGRATIDVQVNQPTPTVTLHAAEITFQSVRITSSPVLCLEAGCQPAARVCRGVPARPRSDP